MSRERLEEIRKDKALSNDDAVIKNSHYEWLIEQVERVQEMKEEIKRMRSALKTIAWKIEASNPQAMIMKDIARKGLYGDE